jgi:hypothetical protein
MTHMTSPDRDTEIYRLYVDTAERNIDRRIETNKFYLTLVAGIFVAYAFLLEGKLHTAPQSVDLIHAIAHWTLPVLLLIVSVTWFLSLRTFRSISAAKYKVIGDMERLLPYDPFGKEWDARTKFLTGSGVEMIVPVLFFLIALSGLAFLAWVRYAPLP